MLRVIVVLMIAVLLASATHAESRIALLVTNQAYRQPGAVLTNTHRDGEILKTALEKVGFKVWVTKDTANEGALLLAIDAHVRRLNEAGRDAVGFFYYSGHGAADRQNGDNYLIPTEMPITRADQLPLMAVRLERITSTLARAGKMSFVVFDACRNVPLERTDKSTFKGFVPVVEQYGLLLAFATGPGTVAIDNNLYAKALADELTKPDLEASQVFRRVRQRVRADTSQAQSPEHLDKRDYDFHFVVAASKPELSASPPPTLQRFSEAAEAWASVKDSTDVRDLEAYRRQYGPSNPFYDRQAERRIDELKKQTAAAAPPAQPKPLLAPLIDTTVGLLSPSRAAKPLTPAEERALKPKDNFKECPNCPEMVVVPAGSFMMGSPADEEGRSSTNGEKLPRLVAINRSFAVGKFEVTFEEWDACVVDRGCSHRPWDGVINKEGWGRGNHPVINVSWTHVTNEYLPWLSRKTGKAYRLLTEAEWEYAARGVTSPSAPHPRYWWGQNASYDFANYGKVGGSGHKEGRDQWENAAPVGQFPANPFGLHDMHGNVWEWVSDCGETCEYRALRGGSFVDGPNSIRSAYRLHLITPEGANYDTGFRVARLLTPAP